LGVVSDSMASHNAIRGPAVRRLVPEEGREIARTSLRGNLIRPMVEPESIDFDRSRVLRIDD